jgi:RNA polymerase sigma-70 factor (ECF subfamily)
LAALDRLDPSVQEVVLLKFQGGLSYREIAAITDRTVSHVGVILHEAVKEIRRSLDEQPAPRHQGGKR